MTRSRWSSTATVLVVLLGLVNLPMPFFGDQGLYSLGARELAGGHRLYADWWDFKQPGIFLFFRAASLLFGFVEWGPHLLALVWLVGWSLLAARLLRDRWDVTWGIGAFLVASIGFFELTAQPRHLDQLEILCSPVVLVGLLLVRRAIDEDATRLAVLGGLCGGLVAVFKLQYGVLVGIPLVVHLASKRNVAWRVALPAAAGVVAPVLLVVAWCARQHATSDLVDAWFTYPRRLLGEGATRDSARFTDMVKGTTTLLAPLVLAAVVGVVERVRERTASRVHADLVVAVAAMSVLNLVQLWNDYHFLLLFSTLAVLVVDGLVALQRRGGVVLLGAAALLLVASLPSLAHGAKKDLALLANIGDGPGFQEDVTPGYADIAATGAALRELDGGVFAMADPTIYLYARQPQALRFNGWSPQDLLDDQWAELAAGLAAADGPRYVFVQEGFDGQFEGAGAGFAAAIEAGYDFDEELPIGVLYERRP